ncbi:hypothetical protein Pelo_1540 [Pelomyxa schiedti]|nr:hypothetical protein Pelo_1540 [Pelomyxa schiedti]
MEPAHRRTLLRALDQIKCPTAFEALDAVGRAHPTMRALPALLSNGERIVVDVEKWIIVNKTGGTNSRKGDDSRKLALLARDAVLSYSGTSATRFVLEFVLQLSERGYFDTELLGALSIDLTPTILLMADDFMPDIFTRNFPDSWRKVICDTWVTDIHILSASGAIFRGPQLTSFWAMLWFSNFRKFLVPYETALTEIVQRLLPMCSEYYVPCVGLCTTIMQTSAELPLLTATATDWVVNLIGTSNLYILQTVKFWSTLEGKGTVALSLTARLVESLLPRLPEFSKMDHELFKIFLSVLTDFCIVDGSTKDKLVEFGLRDTQHPGCAALVLIPLSLTNTSIPENLLLKALGFFSNFESPTFQILSRAFFPFPFNKILNHSPLDELFHQALRFLFGAPHSIHILYLLGSLLKLSSFTLADSSAMASFYEFISAKYHETWKEAPKTITWKKVNQNRGGQEYTITQACDSDISLYELISVMISTALISSKRGELTSILLPMLQNHSEIHHRLIELSDLSNNSLVDFFISVDVNNKTRLFQYALKAGNKPLVGELLANHGLTLDCQLNEGSQSFDTRDYFTPLGLCCRSQHSLPCARMLLEMGADPNLPVSLPLLKYFVRTTDSFQAISLLLEFGAQFDKDTLIEALSAGNSKVVKLLWCHGATLPQDFLILPKCLHHLTSPATWSPADRQFFPKWFLVVLKTVILCWNRLARTEQTPVSALVEKDRLVTSTLGSLPATLLHTVIGLLSPLDFPGRHISRG